MVRSNLVNLKIIKFQVFDVRCGNGGKANKFSLEQHFKNCRPQNIWIYEFYWSGRAPQHPPPPISATWPHKLAPRPTRHFYTSTLHQNICFALCVPFHIYIVYTYIKDIYFYFTKYLWTLHHHRRHRRSTMNSISYKKKYPQYIFTIITHLYSYIQRYI